MSRVSTYLNFMGTTEEAFRLYSSVSGTEITGDIARIGDMPSRPGAPGSDSTGMQQMPWAYWGTALDRFGVRWMFNCYEPAP